MRRSRQRCIACTSSDWRAIQALAAAGPERAARIVGSMIDALRRGPRPVRRRHIAFHILLLCNCIDRKQLYFKSLGKILC